MNYDHLKLAGALLDEDHPINRELVCWMSMSDGVRNILRDLSKFCNVATCVNGPVPAGSMDGSGLNFDGVNDYLYIADNPSIKLGVNHSMFVRFMLFNTNADQYILAKGENAVDFNNYALKLGVCDAGGAAGKLNYTINAATRVSVNQSGSPIANVWTDLLGTYDGSVGRLYLNGALDASTSQANSSLTTSAAKLQSGSDLGTRYLFTGIIAQYRLWKRTLRPEDAWLLHAQPNTGLYIPSPTKWFGSSFVPRAIVM